MDEDIPSIKRNKSRGSRIREVSPSQEDTPSVTAETLAQKLKNKQKKAKAQGRLSFGNDDQVCFTFII